MERMRMRRCSVSVCAHRNPLNAHNSNVIDITFEYFYDMGYLSKRYQKHPCTENY